MTKLDPAWLEAFDKELLHLFAIDHRDAGMDEYLLGCYAGLPPRYAALAFGSDYDLVRDDALWPRAGMALQSQAVSQSAHLGSQPCGRIVAFETPILCKPCFSMRIRAVT